ncbi:MAG: hypothetical protein ABIO16_13830 [Nocardioides sp.]
MLVSIHLVARLFGMPLLRIDGDIHLRDEPADLTPVRRPHQAVVRSAADVPAGGLLAVAVADLARVDDLDRARRNGTRRGA